MRKSKGGARYSVLMRPTNSKKYIFRHEKIFLRDSIIHLS